MSRRTKGRAWRCAYKMTHADDAAAGRAELISDSCGRRPYLRFETADGKYIGAFTGRVLTNMARLILDSYRRGASPGEKEAKR